MPSLIFLSTLLLSMHSFAFDVQVAPQEVIPGDVFLVRVQAEEYDSVKAEFRGDKINLTHSENGYRIALVPVDINTLPRKYPVTIQYGTENQRVEITVKAHEFKTIKLTLPEGKVTLSPENQKRAAKEAVLLKGIWSKRTSKVWNGRFSAPIDTEISTEFGVKRIMNEKKTSIHRGMDFRGKTGTPIKAINSGTVVFSSDLFFGGNTLIVDHGMGLYSIYMHLSKFNMLNGNKVRTGDVIGFVGNSGRATGPHLHVSVKLNGFSVNPESLFKLEL